MKQTVSLKSLAKELQISVSTVSKSLHNSDEISAKTKERVQELARLRGYSPNPIAVRLQKQATMQIGLILPEIENPFFASVLKGIEAKVSKTPYTIVTCFSNESITQEKKHLNFFEKGTVDGIIMCLAEETNVKKSYKHIQNIKNREIPIVLFDRIPAQDLGIDTVSVNDVESIIQAYEKLASNPSNKHIGFVSSIPNLIVGRLRKEGYLKVAKNPILVESEDISTLKKNINHFFDENKLDAIIAADIGATTVCHSKAFKRNLTFKKDFSLIGYVNSSHNDLQFPKTSYIDQHPEKMGKEALTLLLGQLNKTKNKESKQTLIPTEIITGDTSL